jgi:hypothetical protein
MFLLALNAIKAGQEIDWDRFTFILVAPFTDFSNELAIFGQSRSVQISKPAKSRPSGQILSRNISEASDIVRAVGSRVVVQSHITKSSGLRLAQLVGLSGRRGW